MQILTILSFFTLLMFAGCTTTYYVPRDPDADEFIEARGNMEGRTAAVIPLEGNDVRLDSVTLRADTLVGYDHDTHAAVVLPLSNVDEISVTSAVRGIGRGIGRGVSIGGSLGLLAGSVYAVAWADLHDGNAILGGPIAGAWLGLFSGAISGALFLSTEHYRFVKEGDYRIGGKEALDRLAPSQTITLKLSVLQDETPEAVSILWKGKLIWLRKSKIRIERGEGMISLTLPIQLLEAPQEK